MPVSKKRKKKSNTKNTLPTENKLSSTLLDFVEPLLEDFDNLEVIKTLVGFGILVWNLSLFPIQDREKHKKDAIESLALEDQQIKADFNEIFDYLIYRKNTIFGNDKRLVLDYKINKDGRLTVKSVDTKEPS